MSGTPVKAIPQVADSIKSADVADGPFSLILNQVENGVAVRMAVLYLLAGGE
jgi:aspartate carbamoyltransferase catalytic subunit